MFDKELGHSLMVQVREWLVKIKKRSEGLTTADDFIASDEGEETFDSICMLFIAAGENLKCVDHEEVFSIIQDDLETLLLSVEKAIKEVE